MDCLLAIYEEAVEEECQGAGSVPPSLCDCFAGQGDCEVAFLAACSEDPSLALCEVCLAGGEEGSDSSAQEGACTAALLEQAQVVVPSA